MVRNMCLYMYILYWIEMSEKLLILPEPYLKVELETSLLADYVSLLYLSQMNDINIFHVIVNDTSVHLELVYDQSFGD